jgi:hypothetical protein
VRTAPHLGRRGSARRALAKRLSILVFPVALASYCVLPVAGASQAIGDVGDLGPPPSDPEIKQALTDFYAAGQPLGSTVDVQFDGPILVGQPTEHAEPPPRPWCVRCGYHDQGIGPMYPIMTLVTVTIQQGLNGSALGTSNSVGTSTTTHNGTSCAGQSRSEYCPAYYFYQDQQGNWQVA